VYFGVHKMDLKLATQLPHPSRRILQEASHSAALRVIGE